MIKKFEYLKIPKEIISLDISYMDRMILSYIYAMDNDNGCTASNGKICDTLNIGKKEQVSRSISKMAKLGFLNVSITTVKAISKRTIRVNKKSIGGLTKSQGGINKKSSVGVDEKLTNIKEEYIKEDIKESEPSKDDFGKSIILPVEMYKVMRSKRPDIHIEPMATPNETTSLIALSKKIRNTITEGRKQKGHPASASKNDIITYFTNLVNNLPDYVFEGRFKPSYLNNRFTDIVKELRGRNTKTKTTLPTYKLEKRRK